MLPFAITTTASLALPASASLAMSGVKGAYNTACLARDERNLNTIMRDNMLSLKAQSALLTAQGSSDVHAYAYNGEVFAVGVVDTQEDRDRIIRSMQNVKDVGAIKGHIRLRDAENKTLSLADSSLENRARMALARHVLHKNAGVEVQAVQGQLCLMGVVGTHAEALDLIQYVETMTGARTLSLLAIRDEYATGHSQTNRLYLLEPGDTAQHRLTLQGNATLPSKPITLLAAQTKPAPAVQLQATPAAQPVWNKARAHMQQRLTTLAQRESNPLARTELLTLASQVGQDRDLSISDRLSVAAAQATQQQAKVKIQGLLAMY